MKGKIEEIEAQYPPPSHHRDHDHDHDHHHKDDEEEEQQPRRGCRPIAYLLGFPFAISAFLLSLAAGIVWILGYVLIISSSPLHSLS